MRGTERQSKSSQLSYQLPSIVQQEQHWHILHTHSQYRVSNRGRSHTYLNWRCDPCIASHRNASGLYWVYSRKNTNTFTQNCGKVRIHACVCMVTYLIRKDGSIKYLVGVEDWSALERESACLRGDQQRLDQEAVIEGIVRYGHQGGGQDHTLQSTIIYNNKRL